jgi:NitT/TauT family transport system ATP-binding protein
MVSTETLLELKNVKYYVTNYLSGSQINIISDLSLKIKSGQITSIMGKSGSGKSTLGKIIANLLNASEGEVIFSTKEPKVSMVFQEFALVPWLSALGNVKLGLSSLPYSESEKEKRAIEMLELVGLESYQNSYPKELSGGMKQRVSIARAIASSPDILVMDEPFASLDLLTTEALRNDFMDLWQHNLLPVKSIVLIAHATEDIAQMSDRVLFLSGSPSNITNEIVAKNKAPREENSE